MRDNEGWIPHDGGEMPCDGNLPVDVKFRDGTVAKNVYVLLARWNHINHERDILFWRPHKNADGQAGHEPIYTDGVPLSAHPAPSQEGHAAGPACSAPDVPVRRWQHEETGRVCETPISPGKRWHEIPAAPKQCEKCGMDLVLGCHVCAAGWPSKLDDIEQARRDALKPDEALIEEIAKRCNTDWWNSRAADVVGTCKTAIREYIRLSAGKGERMLETVDLTYALSGDKEPPHYFMNGKCLNCNKEYLLKIKRGYTAPGFSNCAKCPNCECSKVVAQ